MKKLTPCNFPISEFEFFPNFQICEKSDLESQKRTGGSIEEINNGIGVIFALFGVSRKNFNFLQNFNVKLDTAKVDAPKSYCVACKRKENKFATPILFKMSSKRYFILPLENNTTSEINNNIGKFFLKCAQKVIFTSLHFIL